MDVRRRSLMGQVPITANVTIENIKGSWGESSKTISGYNVYESKSSYNVNNGYDLAKVTFSGYPEFTFLYGSYGESSYDFVVISPLDYVNAQNWTNSSYSGSLLSTSGKQSSSAPNLSYTFTNDGGEHFFYILYRKDSSVNSGADRGYIAFRQLNYLEVSNTQTSISCLSQNITYTITSDMSWNVNTSDSWITLSTNNGSGSSQITATVTLNEGISRTGYITFMSENKIVTCTITQQEYLSNAPTSVSISYNKPYTIVLNSPLPINVTSDSEWLTYEIVQDNSVYNLIVTALIESESGEQCEVIITSGSITKNITVKLVSSLQYISDGLIFELDGQDKLSNSSYCWVDKVGGLAFTNAGSVEELDNGFRFNGTSTSYLNGNFTTLTSASYNNCTIEVVLKSSLESGAWAPVVIFGDWSSTPNAQYIGVSANYNSTANYNHSLSFLARARTGSTICYQIPVNRLMTTSLKSNQPIMANMQYYSDTSTTSMATASNKTLSRIGGRVDGSNIVTFKGDIHAIRVYNRLLTEEEILHNQNIDIQKYNIPI